MDSAAWLAGMLEKEPETIAVATSRTDRKKMELETLKSDVFISRMQVFRAKSVRKKQSSDLTAIMHQKEPSATVSA